LTLIDLDCIISMLSRNSRFSPYSDAGMVMVLKLRTAYAVFFLLYLEVNIISKGFKVNEEIRFKEVRLIGDDSSQLGIVSSKEALDLAEEKELDLVLIAPAANPPVCKIMDFGKFLYEQTKKDKEAKKKQKVINIKEIRLSPTIEEHDINIKVNRARKFILDEDKVKVTIRFRGREADYSHIGKNILEMFRAKLEDICIIEKDAKLEGRNMTMVLAPKKA